MKEAAIEKTFCTTRMAAKLLGVSVGTVQVWVERGLLQAWKTSGGHRRVLRASIDSLLRENSGDLQGGAGNLTAVVRTPQLVQTRPFQVLVLEDDESLLRLYRSRLARWPMAPAVSLANGGVNGLLMMGRCCPDLLITDLNMPGVDGFTMLHGLRHTPELRHTTIVVVTGLDASELARQGGVPEGIEVLPKPVPFERLKAIAVVLAGSSSVFREDAIDAHEV